MIKASICGALITLFFCALSLADVPQDDVVTAGLWHMDETLEDGLVTPDDDLYNPGRDRDLLLTYPGTNETPPSLVTGHDGNALLFEGTQIARCDNFWNSSYTEFKLEHWLYLSALASEVGAAETYMFTSSVFETDMWPNSGLDYMRFKVYMTSGELTATIPVYDLKNQWLYIVCTYDANKNLVFSITPESGVERTATATGGYALKAVTCGFQFGYTPGKPAERGFRGMIDEVKISNRMVVPHYAFSPDPANGSTVIGSTVVLGWSKGLVAQSSDVYFGTSSSGVSNALKLDGDIDGSTTVDLQDFSYLAGTWLESPQYPCGDLDYSGLVDMTDLSWLAADWLMPSDPLFLGSTPDSTMNAPALSASTTYTWRVASANCLETDPGNLWQFTTGSAQATSPSPGNGGGNVSVSGNTVLLEWTPGFGSTSFDVYFAAGGSPVFYATVSTPSVISPSLLPETAYSWRVDSIGPEGTAVGIVWNFTTGSIGAMNPSPADTETDVKYFLDGMQLTWESVFEPQTYEVYFGTVNPPPYLDSVTEPTLLTPAVSSNITYYWRVNCLSPLGNATGPVWQFTTATPAFPTAEGFGRFAKGGRGGSIYHVTNLNDSGTGSLRDAVSVSERTIVFDVGGQIVLSSRLGITKNRLTIAGQTAPGDGISIAGPGISVGADDLIIRYLRVRYTHTAQDDCFSLNSTCDNIIVDHVSTSWGADEVFSITSSRNITAQWCIISEGQDFLSHSKGSLLEWPQLTMHHCLYAHNDDRNPKNKGVFDYRNNVVYNWGFAPYIAGDSAGLSYANCVGNYYIAGADTSTDPGIMIVRGNLNYSLYLSDNRIDSNCNGNLDGLDLGTAVIEPTQPVNLMSTPFAYPTVATDSPETAYTRVLDHVGCSLVRDSIDTRIINDVINQSGGIIYSYTDVGGLGTITGGTTPTDTDQDGMPDDWEIAHDLDENDPEDRNEDPDGDGYTHLEDYLNELAGTP